MTKNKRQINKVRTDALELKIAFYTYMGQYERAQAILDLSREMNAPIDEIWIAERVKLYRTYDKDK